MIPYASSYQYGILQAEGGIIVEDCDIWGFGNSICFFGVRQKTVVRCWIYDAANPGSGATLYHTDGPGHLNGSGCDNVLIRDCTIASLGNTNGIAFQVADRGYHNIIVRHNYLSGFSYLVDMCHNGPGPCTGMQFINNTFATDVAWTYGPLYDNYSGQFSAANPTNIWSGNTLRVYPGSICRAQAHPVFTAADNGKFIWPDITYHTTDWVP